MTSTSLTHGLTQTTSNSIHPNANIWLSLEKDLTIRPQPLLCRVTILNVLSILNTWAYFYQQTSPGQPMLSLYAVRRGNYWDYCTENTINMLSHRSHLEYVSPVWNPYLQKNINTLEEVQKFALRMCSKQRDQAYSQLFQLFNIPTLSECRLYLDLCTMFKVVHDYLNFLLAFWTHIMAELQALTGHFCFIDPSPALTIIIIPLFPIQSLHGTPYQLHLYLIVYLFLEVMYGCISHVTIAILCILCWSA